MTTSSFHCERTWLGGRDVATDVMVTAVDGTITAVEPQALPDPRAARLHGLVLPGMVSAHSHAFHRALRGRTSSGRGTFWTWRDAMYELAAGISPDGYRDLATGVFAEMLLAGYTSVGEFHYLHHDADGRAYADPNEMTRALLDAAAETGIRLTVLDTCYLTSGPGRAPEGVQRRFADDDAESWAARVDGLGAVPSTASVGAAVHSVRACDPASIAVVASWAKARDRVLHAHVSEQVAENDESLTAHGATPTAVLADAGALDARFTAVHATHLSDADRRLLAASTVGVCICPTTEEDLGDGLCDLTALRALHDVTVSVGSDSNAVIDPFLEARALEGHERLRTGHRGTMGPEALADAMTAGGAVALGRPSGGIVVGAPCDLVAVATTSVRLAPVRDDDLLASVLASATGSDVATVVVDGTVVVEESRHLRVDAAAALARGISGLPT